MVMRPSSLLLAFLFAQSIICTSPLFAQHLDFLELRHLTAELEKAIIEAKQVSDQPPIFIVQKVALKLKGENRTSAQGGLSFSIPIFKAGIDLSAKANETLSEALDLELIPRERVTVGGPTFVDFVSLVRVLKVSFKSDTRLRAASVAYSLRWALQVAGDGKVNVVVAKLGGEIARENSQEVTFHLCETNNGADCIR
jgi:hypothetical protein